MTLVLDRYPLVYRSTIVTEVMSITQHGESVCLVGLAGVGKSNLAHFLEVSAVVRHYLPSSAAERTHFRHIEFSAEVSVDAVYTAMATQVRYVARQRGVGLPGPGNDESAFTHLRHLISEICGEQNQRIIFVFDEFEALLRTLPSHFLQDLRTLRDDHRTSRNVVFLLITHRMPQLISRQPLIQQGGKFLEIIERQIFALPPYSEADAQSMVDALARRHSLEPAMLGSDLRDMFFHLSGGHSKLLAQVFTEMHPTFKQSVRRIENLVGKPGSLRTTCEHIWQHLHREEQAALEMLAAGQEVEDVMLDFLHKRGLVYVQPKVTFFSPIFLAYVRSRPKPPSTSSPTSFGI